ncbi:MAG: flagellar transcriptional regulator FlhD [Burkholderiales bacterium]
MTNDQLLDEIREANLSYLVLAQNMIRGDRAQALYRLGISEDVADIIGNLTLAQCLKIAARNVLICRFRFEDDMVWGLLTDHGRDQSAKQIHASILLASHVVESVEVAA